MIETRFALPHIELAGLEFGQSTTTPILAIHGWLDNAASFVPLSEHLTQHHMFAVDQAGHGLSCSRPDGANYHQFDFVQDVFELVTSQGWQKVHLLGHSMGGIISSLFAATYPERVESLVMIEAFGPLTKPSDTSTEQLRESIQSRHRLMHSDVRHPQSMDSAVNARLKAGGIGEPAARLLMQRNLQQDGEALRWRTDRRLRSVSSLRLTDDQARAFVAALNCPVLAILGDQGFQRTRDLVAARRSLVKNLQVTTISGGHHLHMDNPSEVAAVIRQFYADLP